MKLYVAGPMRGYDQFNFPAFDRASAVLRAAGHEVVSPAEMDREKGLDETANTTEGFDVQDALRRDFAVILECDGIVMLPGWEASTGANAERFVAETTGRQVFLLDPYWLLTDEAGNWRYDWISTDSQEWLMIPVDPVETVQPRYAEAADPSPECSPEDGYLHGHPLACREDHEAAAGGEVRVVDPKTGGAKGRKSERTDLLPFFALSELAEHYGRGAAKYEDHNWRRGYDWSLSYGALMRHLFAWLRGEDRDPETGSLHTVAVAWHALALVEFQMLDLGTDDRWQAPERKREAPPASAAWVPEVEA